MWNCWTLPFKTLGLKGSWGHSFYSTRKAVYNYLGVFQYCYVYSIYSSSWPQYVIVHFNWYLKVDVKTLCLTDVGAWWPRSGASKDVVTHFIVQSTVMWKRKNKMLAGTQLQITSWCTQCIPWINTTCASFPGKENGQTNLCVWKYLSYRLEISLTAF